MSCGNMSSYRSTSRVPPWLYGLSIATIVFAISQSFLTESLWLDECVSAWVASGTLQDAITRSWNFQGQSPLYYVILWSWQQFFGNSEFALRSLSILTLLLTGIGLWSFARKFLAPDSALFAVLLLFSFDSVLITISARPYGLALGISVFSFLQLSRWIESGKLFDGIKYLLLVTLLFYAHYLFLFAFPVHLLMVLTAKENRARFGQCATLFLIGALLAIPGFMQLSHLAARRSELSFAGKPDLFLLITTAVPIPFMVYLGCAIILGLLLGKGHRLIASKDGKLSPVTLLAWCFLAPITLFVLSHLGQGSIFLPRYLVWSLLGLALIGATIHGSMQDARGRLVAVIVLCALWVMRESDRRWQIEDWRGAASIVANSSIGERPVTLLYSGLIESEKIDSIESDQEYLSAPFRHYQAGGEIISIPGYLAAPKATEYLESLLKKIANSSFYLVLLDNQFKSEGKEKISVVAAYQKFLSERGFSVSTIEANGRVKVIKVIRNDL